MRRKPKHTFNGDKDAELQYRLHVWRHNSFKGIVARARAGMMGIIESRSTSSAAQQEAAHILARLDALAKDLELRIDPDDLFKTKEPRAPLPF